MAKFLDSKSSPFNRNMRCTYIFFIRLMRPSDGSTDLSYSGTVFLVSLAFFSISVTCDQLSGFVLATDTITMSDEITRYVVFCLSCLEIVTWFHFPRTFFWIYFVEKFVNGKNVVFSIEIIYTEFHWLISKNATYIVARNRFHFLQGNVKFDKIWSLIPSCKNALKCSGHTLQVTTF